jgi:hypothetical protein
VGKPSKKQSQISDERNDNVEDIIDLMTFNDLSSEGPKSMLALASLLFECKNCGKCCIEEDDISVTGKDIVKMSRFLGVSGSEFKKKYTKPTVLGPHISGIVSLITPCPFYKNNMCSIYQLGPLYVQCFPA